MGPEKRSKVIADIDKKITDYHEAGHAVVNYMQGGETKVHKITMIPRGPAGGYTMPLPAEERMYHSKKQFLDEMSELYGGRAAEEIIFGKEYITTGASSDIQRATAIARYIVTQIGMDEKFGPILLDGTQDGDMFQRKYYSEQTGKEIDDEIRRLVKERYQKAIDLLVSNVINHCQNLKKNFMYIRKIILINLSINAFIVNILSKRIFINYSYK